MYEAFIDLDELILRCRDKLSRKFIQEAVSCYRAGAFRSCIVATWNAVVFDFLHKLRELELCGDPNAAKLLEEFDKLRKSGKQFKELWQFESSIPEIALTKFELISTVEKSDIERLFEDRSRCAHPSMTSLEEPFEATAELARYHLRSAVTHLLERPPVQGRAARERIFQDIKSEHFPVDTERAIKYFQKSPLARARFTLVKDIVIVLTKSLLLEERLEDERSRQFSALNAISSMYPQETREILNTQLSEIIINRVTDENWDKTIVYLGSISAWDSLSEPCRLKAESYIDKIEIYETSQRFSRRLSENAIFIMTKASHIDFLREAIVKKFQISLNDIFSLKKNCRDDLFREKIIIPVLHNSAPQATLDDLLLMISDPVLRSDENIKSYIDQQIKDSSLAELTSTASKYQEKWLLDLIESELEVKIPTTDLRSLLSSKSTYESIDEPKASLVEIFNDFIAKQFKEMRETISLKETVSLIGNYHKDDFFIDFLIKSDLKEMISTANLKDLLNAKSTYKSIDKPRSDILKLLDDYITQQLETASLDELPQQRYLDEIIDDELTKPFLMRDISAVIDRFSRSGNYNSAASNSRLLVKIAEYLSPAQWENILESFFQNDQLYCSYNCYEEFEALFKKSLELSNSVQPYWITFRDKLNKFNTEHSNSLKRLIDSRR